MEKFPAMFRLSNETGFPHGGVVDFVDNHVDPTTGTLRERGVLENNSGLLIPGFFARLCIPGSDRYQALLVPDIAIGNDQNRRIVLVVNKDNIVEARVVEPGALFGGLRSITSGLNPDDLVIINGLMHARPGATGRPDRAGDQDRFRRIFRSRVGRRKTIPSTEAISPDEPANSAPSTEPATQPTTGNGQ